MYILTHYENGLESPESLRDLIVESLDSDKIQDIEVIDLRNQTAIADYMIVASGTSSRHVAAACEKLRERLKGVGHNDVRMEGEKQGDWVVVDALDVIVHVFRPEVRSFYNIEKMWRSTPTPQISGVTSPLVTAR
ncbi:ribosome silencing factor [Micavibrio aeruginosavorus]|nr:ribosome silencing factor [Micavibrio aeruginosavorus]